jgi:hypothetical protein
VLHLLSRLYLIGGKALTAHTSSTGEVTANINTLTPGVIVQKRHDCLWSCRWRRRRCWRAITGYVAASETGGVVGETRISWKVVHLLRILIPVPNKFKVVFRRVEGGGGKII